jgi:FAD/FMN-containing dehydrogenase
MEDGGALAGQTEKVVQALERLVRCPVLADDKTLNRYATDFSIYRARPLVVVFPQDLEDVVSVVNSARSEGIPLSPRQGGAARRAVPCGGASC